MNRLHLRGLLFAAAFFGIVCGAAGKPAFDPEPLLPRKIVIGAKPALDVEEPMVL